MVSGTAAPQLGTPTSWRQIPGAQSSDSAPARRGHCLLLGASETLGGKARGSPGLGRAHLQRAAAAGRAGGLGAPPAGPRDPPLPRPAPGARRPRPAPPPPHPLPNHPHLSVALVESMHKPRNQERNEWIDWMDGWRDGGMEGWRDGASQAECFLTEERALCLGMWACVSARVGVSARVHVDVCVGVSIRVCGSVWVRVRAHNARSC